MALPELSEVAEKTWKAWRSGRRTPIRARPAQQPQGARPCVQGVAHAAAHACHLRTVLLCVPLGKPEGVLSRQALASFMPLEGAVLTEPLCPSAIERDCRAAQAIALPEAQNIEW